MGECSCSSSAAQRGGKAPDRVLRSAICRLQRDAAVGERRADVDDLAGGLSTHLLQGGHGPIHDAEVGHLGNAAKFFRCDVADQRETVTIASLTQMLIGPSSPAKRSAAAKTSFASLTSIGAIATS